MSDVLEKARIAQLLQNWGTWRDSGDFERLETCYAENATMVTSWYDGPAAEFVANSRRMHGKQPDETGAIHLIGGTTTEIRADRALAQTRITLLMRGMVHAKLVDVTVYGRFFDFLIKRDGDWYIHRREPVYDKDTLQAVDPDDAAQPYPNKPINLIVGTAPGGGFDLVARMAAKAMSKNLGQGIVVSNRPGAGSLVGTMAVLNAPADGYTLGMGGLSNLVFNGALYKNLPYKPLTDFVPIGIVAESPYVLVGRPDLPFSDVPGLIAFARANPGKLNIATAGVGTGQQVLAAALLMDAGLEVVQVPYQGAQAVYPDLLGGRVDLFVDTLPSARRFIEGKQVNAYFTTGERRHATAPDIPTAAEVGLPGLQVTSWFGLVASSKVPGENVDRLGQALKAALVDQEFQAELMAAGFDPKPYISHQETARFIEAEYEKWTAVIREAGISAD